MIRACALAPAGYLELTNTEPEEPSDEDEVCDTSCEVFGASATDKCEFGGHAMFTDRAGDHVIPALCTW